MCPEACFLKKKNYLFIFREGKGRRKRGRDSSVCGCLARAPYWGPGRKSIPCLMGMENGDSLVHGLALNPLSHTSQGLRHAFITSLLLRFSQKRCSGTHCFGGHMDLLDVTPLPPHPRRGKQPALSGMNKSPYSAS